MPRERDVPYIAAGFREDAGRLIENFLAKKNLKFHVFAVEWRHLKFSLIFWGRETLKELIEFTQECFRSTLLFMDTTNALQKVGAVYLLYSLYMKQPLSLLKDPVKILMTVRNIYDLYKLDAKFHDVEEAMDLLFVIHKLIMMDAIHITFCPIPMGPVVPLSLLKLEPLKTSSFREALSVMTFLNEKEVKVEENSVTGVELKALGQRRAFLKEEQFKKSAEVGQSRRAKECTNSPSENSTTTPVKRSRGRPKIKKISKKGRKKKVVDKDCCQPSLQRGTEIAASLLGTPGPSGVSKKGRKKKVVDKDCCQPSLQRGTEIAASLLGTPGPSGVSKKGRKKKVVDKDCCQPSLQRGTEIAASLLGTPGPSGVPRKKP